MEIEAIVKEVQYVIAPAVMVSSSALLLLGFQTKFSNLASRFRALNQERRLLDRKANKDENEQTRLKSLTEQVEQLMRRASFVKNAILSTYFAIISFVGTSILIFLNAHTSNRFHELLIAVFLLGFLSLVLTCVLMMLETGLFFKVIAVEKKL